MIGLWTREWKRDKEKGKSKKGGQEKIVYMATDTKQIKTLGEDSLNYDKLKKKKGAQSIFVPLLSGGISPAPSSCLCAKTLRLTGCCGWFCQTFGGVFASFCSMF